ncbi:hypothetical protein CAY60_010135 [Shouchella clausii]|uniref:Tetratricopeptide repeat protein n=1 Tax=Shouchella rhizosphaerae TaxID=866786 RepID=A0ABZ2CU22_9BACI|nr:MULTISPECIES: hypothetical protein [Shouchella]MCM3313368.1 hypothetical protein [Psychrobacillus sp. MER TA 17]ALA54443.1 TPR repeat protein [Shouchella clausii]KKI87724.1 hypothetical protein WZ76_04480 [Shouchella clausii]MBU3232447.1 hypothetical protein [Shouchella clausii]MBU3265825.1 hypothetical protein [Shouchella clausii]
MTNEHHHEPQNIILFPGVVKRLVEEGMDELKQKNGQKALQLFSQAETYEPTSAQARFGVVLSLIELNRQEEAVEKTKALLNEGIGDYYETLQVHVSLLVQLSRYEEVVHLLETVLSENRLPSEHAETFYELLHFSRQMSSSQAYDASLLDEEHKKETELELRAGLHATNEPAKWKALQTVKQLNVKALLKDVRELAADENAKALMRTYALVLLHDWNDRLPIVIKKEERSMEVQPAELPIPGERDIDKAIRQALEEQLEQEDPVLLQMARQLHHTYLLITYPFLPDPPNPKAWACAFHLVAAEQLGLETDEEDMVDCYGCKRFDVLCASNEIEALEKDILLESQDQNQWFHT